MGLCYSKEDIDNKRGDDKNVSTPSRSISGTPRSYIWKKDDTPHPGCAGRQFQFLIPDKNYG